MRWFWLGSEIVKVARESRFRFLDTVIEGGRFGIGFAGRVDGSLPVMTCVRATVLYPAAQQY